MIYALQRLQDKDQFRATLSCIWTVLISCMPLQLGQGHYTPDCPVMVAIAIPLLLELRGSATSCRSVSARQRSSKVTYVLLTVIGIILLVK